MQPDLRQAEPRAATGRAMTTTMTAQLARNHPANRRRARAVRRRICAPAQSARPRAQPRRARHLLGHVVGALLLQMLARASEEAADRGAVGDLRPGRECRGDRHRRRRRGDLQDGVHNHPSYIEPYQGAATGVGGILRDVFTMGARPIANLNALRFGRPDHPKTRHLVSGVVQGIGGYGNCVGVPTVGGEVNFDPAYDGNILVNAMTVGVAKADKIFYSAAAGIGNSVVYVGSKTGRDGIHGATMASRRFLRGQRGEAPDGPGRRPVHREIADRSLPRADGVGRDRRHPGHGRGRPDLLVGRDGEQGRRRHPPRHERGALPRGGHDALRDDAVGDRRSGC